KGFGVAAPYDPSKTYNVQDVVTLDGTSYVAIAPSTGQTPPNAAFWTVLAAKGGTGAKGDKGDKGDPGNGDMTGSNNLSELTNLPLARQNLGAPGLATSNVFTDATEATGAGTTAAQIISGGLEVLKKIFVSGLATFRAAVSIVDTTASTSSTTGALKVA